MDDAFFSVHRDLPREGPGLPDDVAWALAASGVTGPVRILDAACGPGADLVTLAEHLPEAEIHGIDAVAHFVAAAQARVHRFGPRVRVTQGDMAKIEGPYDLIWCAGALYFLGLTQGLTLWRSALAQGGAVAFSEPVLLGGPEPQVVSEFWAEYPQITDHAGIVARVRQAGFEVVGHRLISGDAWAAYYNPMQVRVDRLRATGDTRLTAALDEAAREMALWQAAPDRIAYNLVLVRPA